MVQIIRETMAPTLISLLLLVIFPTDGQDLDPPVVTFQMVTWTDNPPYYIAKKKDLKDRGMIGYAMTTDMLFLCDTKPTVVKDKPRYHYTSHGELVKLFTNPNTTQIQEQLNITESSPTIVVASATSFLIKGNNTINPKFMQLNLFEADGLALLVRREDILLLFKIANGILNCLEIIFFAILLAINMGVVVWVIEFNFGNNQDFPGNVADGICAGIWYCFVTMTTVGYGDKVPKHFITKIIGIVWMMCGLLLTAVITSTVMEAVGNEAPKTNKEMAVITKTFERSMLRKIFPSANPKGYDSYAEIIEALRKEEVGAALVDMSVAAYYLSLPGMDDIKIEKKVEIEFTISLLMYATEKAQVLCEWSEEKLDQWQKYFDQNKEKSDDILQSTFVPSYEVNPYLVRPYDDMFNDDDGGLMMYLAILSSVILVIIVISYVIRKIKRIKIEGKLGNGNNNQGNKATDSTQETLERTIRKILREELQLLRKQEEHQRKEQDVKFCIS